MKQLLSVLALLFIMAGGVSGCALFGDSTESLMAAQINIEQKMETYRTRTGDGPVELQSVLSECNITYSTPTAKEFFRGKLEKDELCGVRITLNVGTTDPAHAQTQAGQVLSKQSETAKEVAGDVVEGAVRGFANPLP